MKRFLTFKPPLIRSKTEKSTKNLDCLKATAHLAAVETAEYDTEAVPHKTRDASSSECNNGVLFNTFTPTIEDNTKRINELTKLVENNFDKVLKAISLQNNQPINTPVRSVVSSVNCFKPQKNLTDLPSANEYIITKTSAANNPTLLQDSLNTRTSQISSYPVTAKTQTLPTPSMSPITTPLDIFSRPYSHQKNLSSYSNFDQSKEKSSNLFYSNNSTIEQLKRQVDILQKKVNKNLNCFRDTNQTNVNNISFIQEPLPENQNFHQTINSRQSICFSERMFRKIIGKNPVNEFKLFELQCKSQGIFNDKTQFEIIIRIWPINDVLEYVKVGKPSSYVCFKQEILSMTPCVPDIHKPLPIWNHTPTFKEIHQLVSNSLTCSPDDLYKHFTIKYSPKWASEILKKDLELPIEKFKNRLMWILEQGSSNLKMNYNNKKSNNQYKLNNKFKRTFYQNRNKTYSQFNQNINNSSKDYRHYQSKLSNKNFNKCRYHARFGEKAKNCEGPQCKMYKNFVERKEKYSKQKPAVVKKALFLEKMQEKGQLERTCEDKSIRTEKANLFSTYKTLNKKLKQKSTKPRIKYSKFQKNEVLCETKSNISTKLLVISDKVSKIPYLFDINAQNSIISKAIVSSYEEDKLAPKILNVWGNSMKALGYTTLNVNIGLQQSFPHKFYVVESNNPCAILGSDFLVKSNLTINANEKTITQSETGVKLKLEPSNPSCKKTIKKEVKKILETFPEIEKESSNREKSKHNHVFNVKLKNEVLPRYKTDITTNSIISKEKIKTSVISC